MAIFRKWPIGRPQAQRLLDGEPAGDQHAGLAALLAAAAAPARPDELADEPAMVAAFVRAGRGPQLTGDERRAGRLRRQGWRRGGIVAVKVAAGLVLFAAGGTAFAAETGSLPAGLQRQAHDLFGSLGVPAPDDDPPPAGPTVAASVAVTPPSGRTGAPSPGATEPAAVELCRAWAAQRHPRGKAMADEQLRDLIAAAGGESEVAAFCAKLLASHPPPPSGANPDASSSPGPGTGNGNGDGPDNNNGNGRGNGNGNGRGNGRGNGGDPPGNGPGQDAPGQDVPGQDAPGNAGPGQDGPGDGGPGG
jgi:hypothetical protein